METVDKRRMTQLSESVLICYRNKNYFKLIIFQTMTFGWLHSFLCKPDTL